MTTEAGRHFDKENNKKAGINEYQGGEDFRIDDVSITSACGEVISVVDLFVSLELFEDIYSNTMSGKFTFLDTGNLPRYLPIMGQSEKITVKYNTPGGDPKQFDMFSYDVPTRKIHQAGRKQVYEISAITEDTYKDMHKKVSKTLTGSITEMIESVFKEFKTKKKLEILTPTDDTEHRFIIPYWSPFATINWLCSRAKGKNANACNFVFYEDRESYKLTTLEELYKQDPPAMEYLFYPKKWRDDPAMDRDTSREFINVFKLDVLDNGNRLQQIRNGMFASNVLTYDLVTKIHKKTEYKLKEKFSKTKHIETNYPISERLDKYSDETDSLYLFRPKHTQLHSKNELGDTAEQVTISDNDEYEKWILNRTSLMEQASNKRIALTSNGDSRIKVGDVIFLSMFGIEPATGSKPSKDPLLSGRYLITAINHQINRDGYNQVFEISKDAELEPVTSALKDAPKPE
tara:strand:- start:297 stop:1676 length:1380 start_codon:yes stop_codon:yes gene_type:complete